jgi:hypothetical protein
LLGGGVLTGLTVEESLGERGLACTLRRRGLVAIVLWWWYRHIEHGWRYVHAVSSGCSLSVASDVSKVIMRTIVVILHHRKLVLPHAGLIGRGDTGWNDGISGSVLGAPWNDVKTLVSPASQLAGFRKMHLILPQCSE